MSHERPEIEPSDGYHLEAFLKDNNLKVFSSSLAANYVLNLNDLAAAFISEQPLEMGLPPFAVSKMKEKLELLIE